MPGASSPYLLLVVFIGAAIAFAVAPLALAWLWAKKYSPAKPGAMKNATYECGLESKGDAWVQFKSQYYLYGILFLVFDVETIFLFPFAVVFLNLSVGAFLAMMIFLFLLVEGLAWAWMKGVLTWQQPAGPAGGVQGFAQAPPDPLCGDVAGRLRANPYSAAKHLLDCRANTD